MRLLKLLFLVLPPSLLSAAPIVSSSAQIISGSMSWTENFQGNNFLTRGSMVNVQTANTSITGVLDMYMSSNYIQNPFSPGFVGSVVVDPSGVICGGGLDFAGFAGGNDCGAGDAFIEGRFDIGAFTYSGGPVTVHLPFTMNLKVKSFIFPQPERDFLFSGSGTADFVAHSVQFQGGAGSEFRTALRGDSLVLNFANVPEPASAALVFLTLAAFAIASARRRAAQ